MEPRGQFAAERGGGVGSVIAEDGSEENDDEFVFLDMEEVEGEQTINIAAFFFFGLINNFSYVVFLSAAESIFADHSGAVLLVNATPGLVLKLSYGFGIHTIPYVYRICAVSIVPFVMFFVVAGAQSRFVRLAAIAFVSLIGGLGESSFLSMTAAYSRSTIGAWSSGTGGAGIFGAGFYFLLTNIFGLDPKTTLRLSSPFPLLLAFTFLFVLRKPTKPSVTDAPPNLLSSSEFRERLPLLRRLFFSYMLPLMLVYYFEYTINQGVLPVIDFVTIGAAPKDAPTERNEKLYVVYQLLYQIGVFISRSSISCFRIERLWVFPVLQLANLVLFLVIAVRETTKSAIVIFGLILWEGLLGGASYVNSFWSVSQNTPSKTREWALGVTALGDTIGITCSAITDTFLECALRRLRGQACQQ